MGFHLDLKFMDASSVMMMKQEFKVLRNLNTNGNQQQSINKLNVQRLKVFYPIQ